MRIIALGLLLITNVCFAVDRQGIFYYEEPSVVEKNAEPLQSPKTSTEVIKQLQKVYNEVLNTSILHPTYKNIYKERMLSMLYMDLAERYQDHAKFVINHEPILNYILRHPVDHTARRSHDQAFDDKRAMHLKSLSKTHGLFFFFASRCPHCHAFAPTIKRFADRYGFTIVPVSLDGQTLPEFPVFKRNRGQAEKLGIKSLPAVVAVEPRNKDVTPVLVSYGNVSVAELAEKLEFHYQQQNKRIKYETLP
jgi:conjugal transfer pilus assembly protein TraF